jgi:TonB-linked SusC/RagA family outer membrane protein
MEALFLFLASTLFFAVPTAHAQTGTITGTVTDSLSGESLPGVNVVVEGTAQGAATDAEGMYTISGVAPGTYTLLASFVGYANERVEDVQVVSGEETVVDIALTSAAYELDEVVAIGYGEQRRQDLTGAISSVSGEEIADLPTQGIEQALQGKAPGVNIRPSSGEPGAAALVQIRGATTFGSTNPLYVIDGMPVINEAATYGQPNPLSLLNPNNIESVEILKDASATAIYGTRAANGVVLIETSRGQEGTTRVSFEASGGVSQFTNTIPLLNSEQYARMVNDASQAAGDEPPPLTQNPEAIQQNTDWQEEAFETGSIQEYNLSISGGSENARYAVSGGLIDEKGTLPRSGYERYNVRINSDFDLHPNLQVTQSAMLARSNWEGGKASGGAITEMLLASPTMPVYNPENEGGFAGPTPENAGNNARENIIGTMNLVENTETQSRILGNARVDYEPLSSLSLRLNLGADVLFSEGFNFTPTWEMAARSNTTATLNESRSSQRTWLIEPTLVFDRVFNQVHSVTATFGFTQQEEIFEVTSGNKQEFPSNALRTINAGLGQSTLQGARSEWGLRSGFGRLNYNYDGRYLLTATFRRDGSSRFGSENRWGNFPSFSLGWRISEESFMEDVSFFNNLKVRGGWGRVGNQSAIGNYEWWSTIDPVADYIFGDEIAPGATFIALGNPQLGWESTEQLNIGVDASVLDGRLSFSANYFEKDTGDLLLRVPINVTSGINRNNGPVRNIGQIENKGFEFDATYSGGAPSGFQYSVSANLSTVQNEVIELGGEQSAIIERLTIESGDALTRTAEGDELGAFYGWVADGLFNSEAEVEQHAEQPAAAPGDVRFRDLNEDGVIDDQDRTKIGSPFPDFTYGVRANVSYQRFDLSVFIDGVQGRDIYNLQRVPLMGLGNVNNNHIDAADRWTPDNTDTDVPRAVGVEGGPNDNNRPSTRFVEDGSYLRISSLQVGYNFDIPNILSSGASTRMRVYAAGQNLATFTEYSGYTPDIASSGNPVLTNGVDVGHFPIARRWSFGVQVTF